MLSARSMKIDTILQCQSNIAYFSSCWAAVLSRESSNSDLSASNSSLKSRFCFSALLRCDLSCSKSSCVSLSAFCDSRSCFWTWDFAACSWSSLKKEIYHLIRSTGLTSLLPNEANFFRLGRDYCNGKFYSTRKKNIHPRILQLCF